MKLRPALALALLACSVGGVGAGVASAAPKPACDLVTDPAGDSSVYPAGGVKSDSLDILSADIATNKNTITGVIRVKKLAAINSSAPTGQTWNANFTAGGIAFQLTAHTTAAGTPVFFAAYNDPTLGGQIESGPTTGVLDTAKNEVRISAPFGTLSNKVAIKPGKTVFSALGASSAAEVLVPDPSGKLGGVLLTDSVSNADDATGKGTYLAAAPSCVTVGK